MTKTMLVKWLEGKKAKAVDVAEEKYNQERSRLIDDACTNFGLTAAAVKIESLLNEVDAIWNKWRKEHEGSEFEITDYYSSSLARITSLYASKEGAALNAILTYMLKIETKDMVISRDNFNELLSNISQSYITVIEAVRASKNAKEAAAYLTELGFDISEVETDKAPITALTVPINTAYLFIGKEAA